MCKTICIHKNIFKNKSNDRKRINNYLNFLNKTNSQKIFKNVNGVKHFEMEGVCWEHRFKKSGCNAVQSSLCRRLSRVRLHWQHSVKLENTF